MIGELAKRLHALGALSRPRYWTHKMTNLAMSTWERRRATPHLRSVPYGVDVITTKRCNLNCRMCIKYDTGPPTDMPMETFEKLAERLFRRMLYVRFCSGGEHLLHPDFLSMLDMCREFGCVVSILTNGMLLTPEMAERMVVESPVWSVNVSFDGATAATFEDIRRGANFDQVLDNVRYLTALRVKREKAFPVVGLRCTLMRCNVEEFPGIVELAKDAGADVVHAAYLITPPDLDESESLWHSPELANRALEEAMRRARRLGVKLFAPGPIHPADGPPRVPRCPLPWGQISVDPNGDVRLCCNAWDRQGIMGNFHREPFERIWNGPRYYTLRYSLSRGEPSYPGCIDCPAACGDPSRPAMHFLREFE